MKRLLLRILRIVIEECSEWFNSIFIQNIPGRIGIYVRFFYWKSKLKKCGKICLNQGCIITAPSNISLGDYIYILEGCSLYAHDNGKITIGDYSACNNNVNINATGDGVIQIGTSVIIGPNTVIRASNHNYSLRDKPISTQGHSGGAIIIEDDVWLGANVVVLPGVTIGTGSIIGAGAVVNKDIPPFSLAAGVPAKVIRENIRM